MGQTGDTADVIGHKSKAAIKINYLIRSIIIIFPTVQQPLFGQGLLNIEVSKSHSDTSQLFGPLGRGIGPTQRPVRDNTQHT